MYEKQKSYLKEILGHRYEVFKNNNVILAGGAITSIFTMNKINDFDIYFKDKKDIYKIVEEFGSVGIVTSKSITIPQAVFIKENYHPLQLITFRTFDNAKDIFDNFDFTICMGAYDFAKEEFVLHKDFIMDNLTKSLRFNEKTQFPLISEIRVDKYKEKGYNIQTSERFKILLAINLLEIKTIEDLREQLSGFYGEDVAEVKDFNGDFNLKETINNLEFSKSNKGVVDVDKLALDILLGENSSVIEFKCKYGSSNSVFFTEELEQININLSPKNAKIISAKEKLGDKFVSSTRKRSMGIEYIVGEFVEPKNNDKPNSGIYFYLKLPDAILNSEFNARVIELEVNTDDVFFNPNYRQFFATKAFVKRVVN